MQPLHHDPEYGRGIRFNRCRSHIVCSPVSSPKRSRTFVSALSEQRPEPLDDRAEFDLLTRVGFEPNLSSLKDWQPHQKSNGPCCARTGCAKWVERCLNPRLQIFSPPLIRLSYRPMIGEDIAARTKKPDVEVTPGFGGFLRIRPSVTSAESGWRAPFHYWNGPIDRHSSLYPGICV